MIGIGAANLLGMGRAGGGSPGGGAEATATTGGVGGATTGAFGTSPSRTDWMLVLAACGVGIAFLALIVAVKG